MCHIFQVELILYIFLILEQEYNQVHARHQENLSIFILMGCIQFFLRDNNQLFFFHKEFVQFSFVFSNQLKVNKASHNMNLV